MMSLLKMDAGNILPVCLVWVLAGPAVEVRAQSPASDRSAAPPARFRHHVVAIQGGQIDWTNGVIVAEGVGKAKGTGPQQRAMARRAAEIIAARNALVAARGAPIDADGRVGGLRAGSIEVQGIVRGQQVAAAEWLPDATPPQYRVRIEVPLWGIGGLGGLFWRTQQVQSLYGQADRVTLNTQPADAAEAVLVLDARGLNVTECLFPKIVDPSGRVLYDLAALSLATARDLPPARYVESSLTFEQLQSDGRADAKPDKSKAAHDANPIAQGHDIPRTEPAGEPREAPFDLSRFARRVAVKVRTVAGSQATDLVLASGDLDLLARSPAVAAAIGRARVIIVVDGPAARPSSTAVHTE